MTINVILDSMDLTTFGLKDIIVNPCNQVGADRDIPIKPYNHLGNDNDGLSEAIRSIHPEYANRYEHLCDSLSIHGDSLDFFMEQEPFSVISFPTKYHWSEDSDLKMIDRYLRSFSFSVIKDHEYFSYGYKFHFPLLGALSSGLGTINPLKSYIMVRSHLEKIESILPEDIDIVFNIYFPITDRG